MSLTIHLVCTHCHAEVQLDGPQTLKQYQGQTCFQCGKGVLR